MTVEARVHATFLTSAPDLARCPPNGEPEIAFAGRSNAGKSSVLNRITGNRRTAKVSKTPGRTQLLNFFDVQGGGRFVDLPGYGYAKAGKSQQAAWQASVNEYLSLRESLVGLVLVMDIRHPNQDYDKELLQWSQASELATHVLLNKADKLSYSKQVQAANKLKRQYADHGTLSVQCFSASKGTGVEELIGVLEGWLATEQVS
ncbi:MAG: ribosome biogenesis GTP-binding protein YihA/YsxC [Pseudomonadales bacterium]